MQEGQKDIKVYFPNEMKGGAYTNSMIVTHTRDEFILDFLMVAPPEGAVNARIIVGPGHMKRICEALKDNIAKYEKNFGTIKIADEPKVVGFVQTK
jgi:hypothetical protein